MGSQLDAFRSVSIIGQRAMMPLGTCYVRTGIYNAIIMIYDNRAFKAILSALYSIAVQHARPSYLMPFGLLQCLLADA